MSQDFDDLTIKIVNQLFKDLFAIKPAFRMAFETQEDLLSSKRHWIAAFKEMNITSIEKLKRGVSAMRASPSPYFPSPGEFIAMCKLTPKDINAPDVHAAYEEALFKDREMLYDHKDAKWSHPCVKYAYEKSDPLFLRSESHKKTFDVFKKNYEEAIEMFADGLIMQQLEHKKPTQQELQDYFWYLHQDKLEMPERLKWIEEHVVVKKPS